MAFVFWIEISGKLKGINNWLANHRQAMALIVGIHKAYVKAGIVGNQDGILAEGLKFLQDLQEGFRALDMVVGDACQLCGKG